MDPPTLQQTFDQAVQFHQAGQLDEAIAAYRSAISLDPNFAPAYAHLGFALADAGQLNEAIPSCFRAVALQRNLPEAHNALGHALRLAGQLDPALAAFRQAIAFKPDFAQAHCGLGNVLRAQGQLDAAIAEFRQALALQPNYVAAHDHLVFAMHSNPTFDARAIADEHRRWNQQHAHPLRNFIVPHPNDRSPDRRLRIGYVSPDFRDHVVGRNVLPLFQQHDRAQFEINCYAHLSTPDAMTAAFQKCTDRWRNITAMSDAEVAAQIRDDQVDILVDLALHTINNRLLVFAHKPAPLQVTFAGYPSSTGLETIDYRLSDPFLDPPGADESLYSERTIRLPDSFWCFDPLDYRDIETNSLPAGENGYITFGCLNNFWKTNDDVLALWAQVMHRVENSRLLTLAPNGSARRRTLDQLTRHNIDAARVEFVSSQSRDKYLRTYRRIDVGLDCFPYNGHTTSLDSYWMGVPVITLVGRHPVSRAGFSQLSNLGLTKLAANSQEQFVQIAADIAGDLAKLAELRRTLRSRMEQSPLMNAQKFARSVECAYRQMWRQWCET